MAIEIEKKYRLTTEQSEQINRRLKEVGAKFVREDFEVNEIYAGAILNERKAVLRIRKIEGKTLLTYKERIENIQAIKQQIEHETEIVDAVAIEKIIESLGFEKALVYEKRRQTWILNAAEIVLDELSFGFFMEIEGAVEDITETEKILEAENFQVEHETYPSLSKKFGKGAGKIIEAKLS